MRWLAFTVYLIAVVRLNYGAPQNPGPESFWTDDYKLFEQIVGKSSDRNLYRPLLIPVNDFESRALEDHEREAEEKKENINHDINQYYVDNTADATQINPYQGHYANLIAQQTLKAIQNDMAKPTKPTFKFVGYNGFKPIDHDNDPETYNYYKQLEVLAKQQAIGFPPKNAAGFKPYIVPVPVPTYATQNPEQTDAYKSIQDILDAHESSKEKNRQKNNTPDKNVDKARYYGQGRSKKANVRYVNNDLSRPLKCGSGRCRKLGHHRIRARPIIIKHKYISDD